MQLILLVCSMHRLTVVILSRRRRILTNTKRFFTSFGMTRWAGGTEMNDEWWIMNNGIILQGGSARPIYSNWMNLQYLPSEYNGGALLMHNRSDSMLLNELMRCIMNWRCRDFSLTLHELHCDTMHYKRFLTYVRNDPMALWSHLTGGRRFI